MRETFRRERERIALACAAAREPVIAQVTAAMRADGAGADAPARAASWYERWIDKAVDEQVYLGLTPEQRRAAVLVRGLPGLEEELARGRGVLLLGTHLGPHTLGPVHLDTLGLTTTILVHREMLAVMPHYGLRHASWLTPGQGFGNRLSAAAGGVFVTYADVDRNGLPSRGAAPADLLVHRAGAVFSWRFRRLPPSVPPPSVPPAADGPAVWELTLTRRRAATATAELVAGVAAEAEEWMLWRRVPTAGTDQPPTLGWAGHDRIVHEQHDGAR